MPATIQRRRSPATQNIIDEVNKKFSQRLNDNCRGAIINHSKDFSAIVVPIIEGLAEEFNLHRSRIYHFTKDARGVACVKLTNKPMPKTGGNRKKGKRRRKSAPRRTASKYPNSPIKPVPNVVSSNSDWATTIGVLAKILDVEEEQVMEQAIANYMSDISRRLSGV